MWPCDFTGIVLIKVLNDFMMLAHAEEKTRVLVIALVFERISNTNRKRTVRLEAPMDHKEIEDELKICLREHGLPENPPAITDGKIPKIQPDQLALVNLQANLLTPGAKHGNGSKTNGRKQGTSQSKRQLATVKGPGGHYVCFNWNNNSCTRPRTQEGCKDASTGKEFAHLCLATTATGNWCLMRHPRKDHK